MITMTTRVNEDIEDPTLSKLFEHNPEQNSNPTQYAIDQTDDVKYYKNFKAIISDNKNSSLKKLH